MNKYKSLMVLFCLFALVSVSANAQTNTNTYQWTRDAASDSWWTTLGTASTSPGVAKTVLAAATVTEILPIPPDATLASITIRSGTASPVILYASTVAGNVSQASLALFTFPTRDEAQFHVDNYSTLTTIPPVYELYNSSGTYSFVQNNGAGANLSNWGTYLVPTGRQDSMVLHVTPVSGALDFFNKNGVTIRVKFLR